MVELLQEPRMKIWDVDAFTREPFRGNPAAVVLLDAPLDDARLAQISDEMNLPATVFLRRGEGVWSIRWFTPRESNLCGHGTLASAHVLWESGLESRDTVEFESRSGSLSARREGERIVLDLPVVSLPERTPSPALANALGAEVQHLAGNAARTLVQLGSAREVEALRPDFGLLEALEPRPVIVTARDEGGHYDFVSRYFKPPAVEDPVTGSAHCALAAFWSPRLGKTTFVARQASSRGGVLYVTLVGDRVQLGGHAVTISEGALRIH
jgi:PhzF family phenazine biosynthesis protein